MRRGSQSMDANYSSAFRATASAPGMDKHPAVASVQLYNECQQQGIPADEAHAAAKESHDWRERWVNERHGGAKNPSPTDCHNASPASYRHRRKRHVGRIRATRSNGSPVSSSSEEEYRARRYSAGAVSISDDDDSDDDLLLPPRNLAMPAPILRPIAVRIARPPSPLSLDDASIDLQVGQQEPSPLELPPPETPRSSVPSVPHMVEEDEDDLDDFPTTRILPHPTNIPPLEAAKSAVLHALASSGGDEKSPLLEAALKPLLLHYVDTHLDARMWGLEGMWLTLTKPTYAGNLGMNHGGDPMYTLGRMSFDMFQPCGLVCSLQGTFNTIEPVMALEECIAPKSLKEEVQEDGAVLRTYDIVTAFTIEPYHPDFVGGSPNQDVHRPIRGIMTTHGYALPDPQVPNRLSIWFTGGVLQPNDDEQDQEEWKKLFCSSPLPERSFGEKAMVLAAKLLMGATLGEMQEDGTMTYEFTRPIGGHGTAYVDVLYLDNGLRIVRGHKGTLFVFVRVPDHTSHGGAP